MKKIILICVFLVITTTVFSANIAGKVIEITGIVHVQQADSEDWQRSEPGRLIYVSDKIRTGDNSGAKLFFVDETTLTLGPDTEISLEEFMFSSSENYRKSRVRVAIGKIRYNIRRKFSPNSEFEVYTPTAIAGIKGSEGIIIVDILDFTTLMQLNGMIELSNIDPGIPGFVIVSAGFFSVVYLGQPPTTPQPIPLGLEALIFEWLGSENEDDPEDLPPPPPPDGSGVGHILTPGFTTEILDQTKDGTITPLPLPPPPPE